jgi:hypothetical protein
VSLRDVYIVATASPELLDVALLEETLEGDDVSLEKMTEHHFVVTAGEVKIDVQFDSREGPLGSTPDLLTGPIELKESLAQARGFYRVKFEPGKPQSTIAVFESLWTVRAILEVVDGVVLDATSFKVHSQHDIEEITELDFDIRDHIAIHSMPIERAEEDGPKKYWVHTHGMIKFSSPDAEMFQVDAQDLPAAEKFLHELCTDLAFEQGPPMRAATATSVGEGFMLLPCDEGRVNLVGVDNELTIDHQADMITVVGIDRRHSLSDILGQYRSRFEQENEEESAHYLKTATRLKPTFKSRFLRRGLMEPLAFLVRAPFEVHPADGNEETELEQLWIEVVQWDEHALIGKLVDGAARTSEWRKGAHVEVDDDQINAVALKRAERMLELEEMEQLLKAELPA